MLLVLPAEVVKSSTAEVYSAFDERAASRVSPSAARLCSPPRFGAPTFRSGASPANDLADSPLSARLLELGAFRADVSGAGPAV